MASLLRRAQVTQEKAEAKEQKKAEVISIPPDFDVWLGWRRIVSRAILVCYTAAMTRVVQEMGDLIKINHGSCSGKKSAADRDAKHLWGKELATFEEVIARHKLSSAQGTTTGHTDQATCQHMKALLPRGNATNLWYTCTECSSRWPRKLNETVLPPATRQPKNQGRSSGSMTD